MFLVSNKECRIHKIINLNHVRDIAISGSSVIQVTYENGQGTQLAQYENNQQCNIAMKIFKNALLTNQNVFEFPDYERIKAEVVNTYQEKSRHKDGSKQKGHGGS